jgi:hypothetical protein
MIPNLIKYDQDLGNNVGNIKILETIFNYWWNDYLENMPFEKAIILL